MIIVQNKERILDDVALVKELQEDKYANKDAFFYLMEKYQGKLFKLATLIIGNPHDAEDALQEAFLSIYQSIEKFQGKSSFYTWIYRIVINKSKDFKQNRRKYKENFIGESELDINDDRLNIESEVEKIEQNNFLLRKVNLLRGIYKEVIILRYFEELSYQEIAEILKVRIGTVKSRLHKAKAKLKKLMLKDKQGGDFFENLEN